MSFLKTSRLLGAILIVIEVASMALFLLCGQTIFTLISTMTLGGGEVPVLVDEKTGVATITFAFTPRNGGYLAATVDVGFGITLTDGSYSVKNTTSVYLLPGAEKDINLTLHVPMDKLKEYADAKGTFDVYTSIRTLSNLVRLDYKALAEGGG